MTGVRTSTSALPSSADVLERVHSSAQRLNPGSPQFQDGLLAARDGDV
jgi:hypothetical protein